MVEITKEYSFEGPEGKVDLLDLFGSRAAEAVCATSKMCGSPGLGPVGHWLPLQVDRGEGGLLGCGRVGRCHREEFGWDRSLRSISVSRTANVFIR